MCHRVRLVPAILVLGTASCAYQPSDPAFLHPAAISEMCIGLLVFAAVLAAVIAALKLRARRRAGAEAAKLRNGLAEAGSVGPLLEMLYRGHLENRGAAATALVRVLPTLTEADNNLLNARQLDLLHRTLKHPDGYLVCAALQALERIGDERSLSCVQALATAAPDSHIRERSAQCLARLQERAAASRPAQTLLRPAQARVDDPASLLRPASAGDAARVEQLLRPST